MSSYIDDSKDSLYNKDQVCDIAAMAAESAVLNALRRLLYSPSEHLDNSIDQKEEQSSDGGSDMPSKVHQRVTLPNGERVWCNGPTMSIAITNLLSAYMANYTQKTMCNTLFFDYAEHWYNTYHTQRVKPNTARNTHTYLTKYIYPALGQKYLHEITFDDVQAVFTSMWSKSASTAAKIKITLHQIFANALEDNLVYKNILESGRYTLPTRKTKRKALTRAEVNDIVANLCRVSKEDRLLLALALYTGMRRGEILALRWDHIDFDNRLIYVDSSVTFINNRPTITSTKSAAGIRQVPLDKNLADILGDYHERDGYVIKNVKDLSSPVTETGFQRMYERIEKTIDLHGATMHVFRHTYATLMKPRCDIKTLQKIMGHSDIKITMDTYVDPIDEDIRKMSEISVFCALPVLQHEPQTQETQDVHGV